MDKLKLSTANIVILVGGRGDAHRLVPGLQQDHPPSFNDRQRPHRRSAPTPRGAAHYFLIATIPALIGIVMAAQVAVAAFAPQVKLPDQVLGLTWTQIHLVLGSRRRS